MIQLNPSDANAYNHRGLAYGKKGEIGRAIADFNTSVELNPNYAGAHHNRGVAYARKGDYDHAILGFNKAIQLNPNDANAHYNRGMAWLYLGDWENAKSDLTIAKGKELDIITSFCSDYESVEDFEQRNNVKLPEDIAAMLTPSAG